MDRTFKLCQLLAVFYLLVCKITAEPPADEKDLDELIKEIFQVPNEQPESTVTQIPHTIPPTFQPETRYPNHSPPSNEDTHHTNPTLQPKPDPQPTPISNTNAENEPNVS